MLRVFFIIILVQLESKLYSCLSLSFLEELVDDGDHAASAQQLEGGEVDVLDVDNKLLELLDLVGLQAGEGGGGQQQGVLIPFQGDLSSMAHEVEDLLRSQFDERQSIG